MLALALASALLFGAPTQATPQSPPPTVQDPSAGPVVDLEDVVVEGRRLEDATRDFVREVGAPARNRGLARWRDGVCVGVVNLQNDAAQYIVDRVSTVAQDVGLTVGAPGCQPSIMVVATADADSFTPAFVDARPRLFRVGASGTDRGAVALERFKTNSRPIRWWTVSVPVDGDTGQIAVRIPGSVGNGSGESVLDYAPVIAVRAASRLGTQIVDDAKRSFVIVDVSKVEGLSILQLADYIAMVSLAQIDPEADTSGYATILNVFADPTRAASLTNWDKAYLQGLYDATRTRLNTTSSRTEIASSIIRAHHDLNKAEDDKEGQ